MRAEQTADSSLSTTLGVSYRMDAQCKAAGAVKQAGSLSRRATVETLLRVHLIDSIRCE